MIEFGHLTHVGLRRDLNEDTYYGDSELGLWLIASPWALGFAGLAAATWSAVLLGIAIAALALWALGTDRELGGWWSPAH